MAAMLSALLAALCVMDFPVPGAGALFPPLTISAPHSAVRTCARHSKQLDKALANRTLWAMHSKNIFMINNSL